MRDLRQSTTATVTAGQFVDKTDGVTPEVAVTTAVRLKKNGAGAVARSSATAIAHDENGYYNVALDTTDTNTLGFMRLMMTDAATHLGVWEDFNVLPPDIYDERYGPQYTLTGAASTTATLDASASAVNDFYLGSMIEITSGTGAGQTRRITAYVGATKVATVHTAWATTPTGATFRIIGDAPVDIGRIVNVALTGTGSGGSPWQP